MPASPVTIAKERRALMKLMDIKPHKVPNRRVDENILIASWNIQNFSNKKTIRALQYIADICERFDIVALQEVKTDLRGLSKLQELLPGNYKIFVTDPTGNYERMAYLYDKRTVIPTGLACEIGFNVLAEGHTGYQLHRSPYCVSFRAGRFDFIMVNTHIYCGSKKEELNWRQEEIDKLVDFIHDHSSKDKSKVFDKDFIIVGDFNIEKMGDRYFKALAKKGFTMPPKMNQLKTNFKQDKTFDKIAWVGKRDSFSYSDCNVIPFKKVLYQDANPKGGKKQISDHLPLWVEFSIKELTQELDQIINRGS